MAWLREMLAIATLSALASLTFAASLNGTEVEPGQVEVDVGSTSLKSTSNSPLFYMNEQCRKIILMYTREPVRLVPWRSKHPPPTQQCGVLVKAATFSSYKLVVTFKKVEMTSASTGGSCRYSRLDLYTGNSVSPSNRISGSDGICGRKAGFEEYTTSSNVLNMVYTTSGLRLHAYEYFEAVVTPYHHGTCKHDEFKCKNHRCVKSDLLCDGYNNCGDDSDEKSCAALLLSVAAIAGIVVGCVVIIGIICSIVICKCCCGACGYERF